MEWHSLPEPENPGSGSHGLLTTEKVHKQHKCHGCPFSTIKVVCHKVICFACYNSCFQALSCPVAPIPTEAASRCFNYCSQSKSVTSAIVPYCLGSTSVGGTWWVFLNGAASGTKPFSSLCFCVEYGGWAFLPHGSIRHVDR